MIIHESIKYYFNLQLRRFSRKAADYGLPAGVLGALMLIAFILGSLYLFYKTPFAGWIYPFIAAFFISYFSDNHVQTIFTKRQTLVLNLLANILITIPFIGFLIYKMEWIPLVILLLVPLFMAIFPVKLNYSFKLPTPFRMWPFEFIVGFRHTFLLVLLSYFLVFKGIQVDNINLAFAALGFIFLLSMSYYFRPEDEYFAWIFNKTPQQFIRAKVKYAIVCVTILAVTPATILLVFVPSLWYIILTVIGVGYLYLITIILGKYAAFPHEISIPQSIILIISFVFPPLLIIVIPSFYKKAIQKLNPILAC